MSTDETFTLTDEEIETQGVGSTSPTADTGDDTTDDTGDVSDTSEDAGDTSDTTNVGGDDSDDTAA